MPNTFVKIASVTVGAGGAGSIDFTSIPSTYTDLCVKYSTRNSAATNDLTIAFNGSSANFSRRYLYGTGSGTGSASGADNFGFVSNNSSFTASTFASGEIYIPNYASSNNKSVSSDSVQETNATAATMYLTALLWSNSAAINQITLTAYAANFVQYSTATLYGIKSS
jgi:hypothetical protein